jgi:hypothetical protein
VCTTVTRHISIRYSSCCHTRVNMLKHVWQQLEYRIDVCRVIPGAHIEHLYLSKKKKNFFSFPVAVNNSIKVGPLVFLS